MFKAKGYIINLGQKQVKVNPFKHNYSLNANGATASVEKRWALKWEGGSI